MSAQVAVLRGVGHGQRELYAWHPARAVPGSRLIEGITGLPVPAAARQQHHFKNEAGSPRRTAR